MPDLTLSARGIEIRVGQRCLIQDLQLRLQPGECWGVLGPNGVGKSRLLLTLAGLHPPHRGSLYLGKQPLRRWPRRQLARHLGLLPQDSQFAFPLSVRDSLLAGLHPHLAAWQRPDAGHWQRLNRALALMELSDLARRSLPGLSGGERRRTELATLIVQDPAVWLLDEPFNHLDLRHQLQLLQLLRILRDAGKGILMSLHDINIARRHCSHLLLLGPQGHELGPAAQLARPARLAPYLGVTLTEIDTPHGGWLIPETAWPSQDSDPTAAGH